MLLSSGIAKEYLGDQNHLIKLDRVREILKKDIGEIKKKDKLPKITKHPRRIFQIKRKDHHIVGSFFFCYYFFI